MPRRASPGTCTLCEQSAAKAAMPAHVATCAPAHDRGGRAELLIQLLFEGAEDPRYWLLLEARATATLRHVDTLLRRTWLECCGHMSAFRVGRAELSKRGALHAVLRPGLHFSHHYDFGSTTTLEAVALGGREGSPGGRAAVRVLARNDPIAWTCADCPVPATLVCPFCMGQEPCHFCDVHARSHRCADEDVYLPVVDSPRMGVCGYGAVG